MKNLIAIISLFLFVSQINAQLISFTKTDSFTLSEMNTLINNNGFSAVITAEYPVDVYKVIYNTEYKGGLTPVSGMVAVPKNTTCKAPMYSYQHGTISKKTDVPSFGSSEGNIVTIFASLGNVVCASDYIGLGSSTVSIHPYMHAYSQGHSVINLMRSVREIDEDIDFNMGNQIFLFGYSQGGFSTTAAVKYIEEDYSDEFTITASAPMSGPYNLDGAQFGMVSSGNVYATPGYLPYVVLSYQSIYENLYSTPNQFFKEPYDSIMPYLFTDHNYGMPTINAAATPVPSDMFKDVVFDEIIANPYHALRVNLQDNDFLDWKPNSPVKLFYCKGDDQVSYLNSEYADSAWNENGATAIEKEDNGNLTHGGCFTPSFINGKLYLESFHNNGVEILISFNENDNTYTVSVLDDDITNYDILWSDNSTSTSLSNIEENTIYDVTINHKTKSCSNSKSFKLEDVYNAINNLEEDNYFTISPNPAKDYFIIKGIETDKNLYVVDLIGSIVLRQNISKNNSKVEVSNLSKGIYYVGMNGVINKRKLVIE